MRWLLIILALLPTMLWGQTSPALNTLTGPYRGPMSGVTPKTLKDSIDVLEARLLAAISDSTGLAFDSVYALSAALADMRNRYLADSTALTAKMDSLAAASKTQDDSLAVRMQRAARDSAAADTVGLTAGSGISITGTAPHRYTIAATGGSGGGGGLPYDTTLYKRILGWPSDSALYSTFSGWRMLDNRAAKADSATGDSLWSNINQLKTSGGRILILGADTVHVYRLTAYDSLPTAGGITSTVSVYGTPRTVIQCKDASAAPFSFTVNRPAGTGTAFLEFRNLRIKTTAAAALISVSRGRLLFDNCDMDGGMLTIPMADGNAGDSLIVFNNCRLLDAVINISARGGLLRVENCEGNIATSNPNFSGPTLHAAKYGWHFIDSRMLGIGSIESSGGSFPVFISGGSLRQTVSNKSMFNYCNIQASGVSFYFHPSATTYAFIGTNHTYNSLSSYTGCFFWGGGASAMSLQVTGCTFRGSATAINLSYGGVVNSCTVQGATTAVVCGGGYTTKIHGLAQNGCSTFISGTPTTVADTLTY